MRKKKGSKSSQGKVAPAKSLVSGSSLAPAASKEQHPTSTLVETDSESDSSSVTPVPLHHPPSISSSTTESQPPVPQSVSLQPKTKNKLPPPGGDGGGAMTPQVQADLATVQAGLSLTLQEEQGGKKNQDDHVFKLLAANKIRQLLVSHNNTLVQEVLRRDWVPALLLWLRPLPTALPPGQPPSSSTSPSAPVSSGNNNRSNSSSSSSSSSSSRDREDGVLEPLNKKRKNHEVTGQSSDASDHDADLSSGGELRTASCLTGGFSGGSVDLQALQTLRLQHLHLQIGALWALTNVAAGPPEHTHTLLAKGVVPVLLRLLETSDNDEILEQSVWIIGNLAGECAASRDAVISTGVLPPIVTCLTQRRGLVPLLKIGSWALSNLCDGQPRRVLDMTLLGPLLGWLLQQQDPEVLSHTCWALSHLCDGPPSHLRQLLAEVPHLCPRLVALLSHSSQKIVKPALRAIGNIVCAEDSDSDSDSGTGGSGSGSGQDYTDLVTCEGADAVACLARLVADGGGSKDLQKEACWTLSNIAAGTIPQIQRVLDSGVLVHIVALATSLPPEEAQQPSQPAAGKKSKQKKGGKNTPSSSSIAQARVEAEVRSEAAWVVLNACSCGSEAQVEQLVDGGCIAVLNGLLEDATMRLMALEGIERILTIGERYALCGYPPPSRNKGGNERGYCACCSEAAARKNSRMHTGRNTRPLVTDSTSKHSSAIEDSGRGTKASGSSDDSDETGGSNGKGKHSGSQSNGTSQNNNHNSNHQKNKNKSSPPQRLNSFAAQLSVRSLQLLSASCGGEGGGGTAHVTKRVAKICKDHFLACALCSEYFNKGEGEGGAELACAEKGAETGPTTATVVYCEECKAYVCSRCDCSVYHLSYQELVWQDIDNPPATAGGKKKKKKSKKKKNSSAVSESNGESGAGGGGEDVKEVVESSRKSANDSGSDSEGSAKADDKISKKQLKKENNSKPTDSPSVSAPQSSSASSSSLSSSSSLPVAVQSIPNGQRQVSLADYADWEPELQPEEEVFTAVEGKRRGKHGKQQAAHSSGSGGGVAGVGGYGTSIRSSGSAIVSGGGSTSLSARAGGATVGSSTESPSHRPLLHPRPPPFVPPPNTSSSTPTTSSYAAALGIAGSRRSTPAATTTTTTSNGSTGSAGSDARTTGGKGVSDKNNKATVAAVVKGAHSSPLSTTTAAIKTSPHLKTQSQPQQSQPQQSQSQSPLQQSPPHMDMGGWPQRHTGGSESGASTVDRDLGLQLDSHPLGMESLDNMDLSALIGGLGLGGSSLPLAQPQQQTSEPSFLPLPPGLGGSGLLGLGSTVGGNGSHSLPVSSSDNSLGFGTGVELEGGAEGFLSDLAEALLRDDD